ARALARGEARGVGVAPGRDPARVPADHRAGLAPAGGARRFGVRHGGDARGAATHLARRRPVGATRPSHGCAHRLPHPRASARARSVNFPGLVVLAIAAGAGWVGYRMGFVRRVTSWGGLALGIVLGVVFVPDIADALRGSPPRTRLLASLAFVIVVATV